MNWDEAKDALQPHFVTRWDALHPPAGTIPIHRTNQKPVSVDGSTAPWLRIRFIPAYSRRIVVGGDVRVHGGHVIVNVFVPLASGDGALDAYCREIEGIWETAHANGLSTEILLFGPSGEGIDQIPAIPDDDTKMLRGGVTVPITFYRAP